MKCHSCGEEIRDTARFCGFCGAEQIVSPAEEVEQAGLPELETAADVIAPETITVNEEPITDIPELEVESAVEAEPEAAIAPVIVEEPAAEPVSMPAMEEIPAPAAAPVEEPAPVPVEEPAPAPVVVPAAPTPQPVPAAPAPAPVATPAPQPTPVAAPAPQPAAAAPAPAPVATPVPQPAPVAAPVPQPQYQVPPQPQYQPAQPVYQAPPQPQYQAPQPVYQPQYQPAQPVYQAPPQPQYQAPRPVYQAPAQPVYQPKPAIQPVQQRPAYQLTTVRGLIKLWLLTIITLGIYPMVMWSRMSVEINMVASRYDGKRTTHFMWMPVLGVLTLGIYMFVWLHKLCNRIGDELRRRNIQYKFSAATFWLWTFVYGMVGCIVTAVVVYLLLSLDIAVSIVYAVGAVMGIASSVGFAVFCHKILKAFNLMNADYNEKG